MPFTATILVIATHGRSFWILDDITPLRQIDAAVQSASAWLYKPATAVRIDNDVFLGTPLPPEEPTAKNPPNGAVVDYYLRSAAQKVMLEIFDGDNKVIRRYISGATPAKRPPLPIAPRWLPNPPALEITPGMHRFVWDLRWSSSGASGEVEDEGFGAPPGPRVVPGTYQVKLTVDGKSFTQPLKIVMDPRSSATSKVLAEQLQLGLEIFAEARKGRQTAAEIASLKKRLDDLKSQVVGKPALLSQLEAIETAITTIDAGDKNSVGGTMGLEAANTGLGSALRAVESGDRSAPSQAIEVFKQSDQAFTARAAEWRKLKSAQLRQFNDALRQASLPPIEISVIDKEDEEQMAQ